MAQEAHEVQDTQEVVHSEYFKKVKTNYDNGSWNLSRVKRAVVKEWITETEYKEITGLEYEQ